MPTKLIVTPEGPVEVELMQAELEQQAKDHTEGQARRQKNDDEALRVATYADDPEVTDGLTQIKGGTAQDIDAFVEQTITLTATDIDALRLEVQGALRAILRRQLKVQFNPTHLLDQLNQATEARARISKK